MINTRLIVLFYMFLFISGTFENTAQAQISIEHTKPKNTNATKERYEERMFYHVGNYAYTQAPYRGLSGITLRKYNKTTFKVDIEKNYHNGILTEVCDAVVFGDYFYIFYIKSNMKTKETSLQAMVVNKGTLALLRVEDIMVTSSYATYFKFTLSSDKKLMAVTAENIYFDDKESTLNRSKLFVKVLDLKLETIWENEFLIKIANDEELDEITPFLSNISDLYFTQKVEMGNHIYKLNESLSMSFIDKVEIPGKISFHEGFNYDCLLMYRDKKEVVLFNYDFERKKIISKMVEFPMGVANSDEAVYASQFFNMEYRESNNTMLCKHIFQSTKSVNSKLRFDLYKKYYLLNEKYETLWETEVEGGVMLEMRSKEMLEFIRVKHVNESTIKYYYSKLDLVDGEYEEMEVNETLYPFLELTSKILIKNRRFEKLNSYEDISNTTHSLMFDFVYLKNNMKRTLGLGKIIYPKM